MGRRVKVLDVFGGFFAIFFGGDRGGLSYDSLKP
jgi:hypothetical protein